jgi:ankyrin repeat protein
MRKLAIKLISAGMLAAQKGQAEMVRLLLEKGAMIDVKNREGKSALDIALQGGHREISELLKARGATD